MKLNYLIPAILISAIVVDVSAQERGTDKGAQKQKWRVQLLHKDNNEGVAVGDIDGGGKLDIPAGEFWYQAPDFKQRPLRKIAAFGLTTWTTTPSTSTTWTVTAISTCLPELSRNPL